MGRAVYIPKAISREVSMYRPTEPPNLAVREAMRAIIGRLRLLFSCGERSPKDAPFLAMLKCSRCSRLNVEGAGRPPRTSVNRWRSKSLCAKLGPTAEVGILKCATGCFVAGLGRHTLPAMELTHMLRDLSKSIWVTGSAYLGSAWMGYWSLRVGIRQRAPKSPVIGGEK